MIAQTWSWLTTAANWRGADGVWVRIVEHLEYTALSLVIALFIAIPLGVVIGHTGRGAGVVGGAVNIVRALPSLGLLVILALWSLGTLPVSIALDFASIAVLVLLAIPPILTSTYAGVAAADADARDAALGMGMSPSQVAFKVEIPIAIPLIISGIRSGYLQAVATATIAAFVSLGGLGRYVLDGLAQHDYPKMAAGGLLVAILAVLGDQLIAVIGRVITSPGLSVRSRHGITQPKGSKVVIPAAT